MHDTKTIGHTASAEEATTAWQDRLPAIIGHAAHLLPAQGPITAFVHHNTLHAFEDYTFSDAVIKAKHIFGCQPYLSEAQYQQKLASERIRTADLRTILEEDLEGIADESIAGLSTRFHLRLAMLRYPLRIGPSAELRWVVAETDALRHYREDTPAGVRERIVQDTRHWVMRDWRNGNVPSTATPSTAPQTTEQRTTDVLASLFRQFGKRNIEQWDDATWEAFTLHLLWRVCRNGVHNLPKPPEPDAHIRPRDLLLESTAEDCDRLVNEHLIRFCAAFLDQGFATWSLPNRELGFYRCFAELQQHGRSPERWLKSLVGELRRIDEAGMSPLESVAESIRLLDIPDSQIEPFITQTLLALRGWAGMIWQMETRADRAARPAPEGTLIEFLAIRLILDRIALSFVAKEHLDYDGPLNGLKQAAKSTIVRHDHHSVEQRAFLTFQLAQLLGWTPKQLLELTKPQWGTLVEEIESFHALERRRVYQMAFERRYRNQTLDALAVQGKRRVGPFSRPRFQAVFCIDDREESFRRHLEEIAPDAETFGVAGFYGVAMYYRGVAEAHFLPLCPVVITPQHYVREEVVLSLEDSHRRRAKTRQMLGTASHQVHMGSRSFAGGALLAALFGPLASIPLVARVLFPRFAGQIRRLGSTFVQPPAVTHLTLERIEEQPGPHDGHLGYSVAEMANIAQRVLGDIGLTHDFARMVLVIGHGSNSLNNPHKAAYDCGACGGGAGGPNARALSEMLNDPRVREILRERGLSIPNETHFVGGFHNTCDDSMTYYDLERIPKSHRAHFAYAREAVDQACDRGAHERCRRFVSAPLDMTFEEARIHVEERSEDLAQARPECGHATNALCIVGRRTKTRGLYLDRRAFLTSYDPTNDPDHAVLTRILQAVIPVCAGINLEYYFSYVDPAGWGCGTKLPHNVASLLGVMDGAASDLRPGLPWQMTEIHEPVRLLFVIETTPDAMNQIMDQNEAISKLCRNEWVQLATMDPSTGRMHVFHRGKFEVYHPENDQLPQVATSSDWYRGWREHLGFALINDNPPKTWSDADTSPTGDKESR